MRVLLRCDAARETGIGHVVRCVALAEEALARGHEVDLLGRIEGELARALTAGTAGLRLLGPAPEQPAELALLLDDHDLLHVDAYDVGDLTDTLAGCVSRPLLSSMHDGEFGRRPSDLTIDPTPGSEAAEPPDPGGWVLRGGRCVPIRRSVLQHASRAAGTKEAPSASSVFVVLGGTDPSGSAPHVARALLATGLSLRVTVVATPHTRMSLDELAADADGRLVVIDPVADVAPRLAESDLVVTAAGSTVWEVCALSRPMAVLVAADNQASGYARVVASGAALGLGDAVDVRDVGATAHRLQSLLVDPDVRAQMARAAHDVVDGLGAWRIVASWEELLAGASRRHGNHGLQVRAVTEGDAETLWRWRNDPATRALSRNVDPIPFDDHRAWLAGSLARPDRRLLMARDHAGDVGTVRWDLRGPGEWEVSITVAPARRGQGLAGPLLAAGEEALAQHLDKVHRLLAVVHTDNEPSRRLFASSGYLPDLPADEQGFSRWSKLAGPAGARPR